MIDTSFREPVVIIIARRRRVASSFDEPTRKLDIDDDATTTENGEDEPNVFDLMSATMVPYEKTYRCASTRQK